MGTFGAHGDALRSLLCLSFALMTAAQYESYSLSSFPAEELMALTEAYGLALDHYAAHNWTQSIVFLERSLRLHRLLKESARYCALHCNRGEESRDGTSFAGNRDLRAYRHVLMKASCVKKCRARFPALQLPPPGRQILDEFGRRSPYRYLHFAHSRVRETLRGETRHKELNDLQSAVPCAHTFLQKNPEDQEMRQLMEEYKSQYDLSGFLTDHEEQPHEAVFLKGVQLVSSGDYSSAAEHLEETLKLYLHQCDLCWAECEGIVQLPPDSDFYAAVADVYLQVLRCKLRCEDDLMPNVGGYFVENFVANIYHHLQYAYYKLNDGRRAVPCAFSYSLFEPEDGVMEQNLRYYKAYSEQWGLETDHFTPRQEALRHFNQTVALKQMLSLVENYLDLDDENFLGAEEAARLASESPDVEFEGMGDYEESIYSDWRQPKGKGDAGESDV